MVEDAKPVIAPLPPKLQDGCTGLLADMPTTVT